MTNSMGPFRELLKPSQQFQWTEDHQTAFTKSKSAVLQQIQKGVRIFQKGRPTCLISDWSREGIGFWLTQKHCSCLSVSPICCKSGWKVVLVGSRFLKPAETRYSVVEGEALAVAYALHKSRHYTLGCPNLCVVVDHKPLLKVMGDRKLDEMTNPRLRSIKERTLCYRFTIQHIPGTSNLVADALSRHPYGQQPTATSTLASMADTHTASPAIIAALASYSPMSWEEVKEETARCATLRELVHILETSGLPNDSRMLNKQLLQFFRHRHDISTEDGVALYKDMIIVPQSLRHRCLRTLHAAHQGTNGMAAMARTRIFWPSIARDIDMIRANCQSCNRKAPSQAKMPPNRPILATRPFAEICCDYMHYGGHSYLVTVDRLSHWPTVERANGSAGLVDVLRKMFATHGIPTTISSDGGPEFTSDRMRSLCRTWGIQHRISSAYHPHSNCRAELGVKTIKRLIQGNTGPNGSLDCDAFRQAMLQYRNTPDPTTGLSPAQLNMGRATNNLLPDRPGKSYAVTAAQLGMDRRTRETRSVVENKKWSAQSKQLPPLLPGDVVRIQNQARRGGTELGQYSPPSLTTST